MDAQEAWNFICPDGFPTSGQRVRLPSGTTNEHLVAIGLSKATRWRSLKRGWFTWDYHGRSYECITNPLSGLAPSEGDVAEHVWRILLPDEDPPHDGQWIGIPLGIQPRDLLEIGMSRSAANRAIREGYFIYYSRDTASREEAKRADWNKYEHPQDEGPGMFQHLTNPYGFVRTQVVRTFNLFDPSSVLFRYMDETDYIQDALLVLWNERHTPGIKNPLPWMACRVRGKVKDAIKKGLRRAQLDVEYAREYGSLLREIEERLCGERYRALDKGE